MTLLASPVASGQASPSSSGAVAPTESATPPAPPPPAPAAPSSEPASPSTACDPWLRRPWFGGLGYASVAPFFGDISGLEEGLRAPTALGASYGVGRTGLLLGGGGGAVLFGRLWLGGKGYALLTGPFENARGEVSLTGGGGGFELGYVASSRAKMLVIPFMGLGGFAYSLEVTNRTSGPMTIQQAAVIPPSQSRKFTSGFATLDVGIRLQRLLFWGHGGFSAGVEVGLLRSLSTRPWQSESVELTDHPGAALDGAYVRLNFGGGGFVFH